MDQQQIYNIVKRHLLKQGARSQDTQEHCLYRGPRGLKCAIGALIKDEFYNPALEDKSANQPEVLDALRRSFGLHPSQLMDVFFLSDLQEIHDRVNPSEWKDALSEFAVHRGLKP